MATGIFLISLVVRLIHLHFFRSTVFVEQSIFDEAFYDQQARIIASGNWIGHKAYFMGPLYSYFLALIYFLFHGSKYAALAIQSGLGSVTCVLTYLIGRKVFSDAAAILAGLVCCFYGILVFYDGLLLMETVILFLNMLCLFLLLKADQTGRSGFFFLAGLCLGLSALGRGSVLLFGSAVAVWIALSARPRRAHRLGALFIFCAAMLLVITPVSIRNYCLEKDFVLISANGGLNFYLGNGPGATGTYRILDEPGATPDDITGRIIAERATGSVMALAEVSRWWFARTLSFIRERPIIFFENLGWKIRLFWNAYEIPQLEWYDATRQLSHILGLPLVASRIIVPAGVLGIIVSIRRRRRITVPLIYIAMQMFAICLFFVTARYRITVLPALTLFASYAFWWFLKSIFNKQYKTLTLAIGWFMILFWSTGPGRISLNMAELRRWHLVTVGIRYSKAETHLDKGIASLRMAVSEYPEDADAHLYYGIVLRKAKAYDHALKELQAASALRHEDPLASFQIGKTYEAMGDDSASVTAFVDALSKAPHYKDAHEHLAFALSNLGRYEEALGHFSAAVAIDPSDSSARVNLGTTYGKLGRIEEAIRQFELALHYDERNWKARYNLAAAFAEQGRLQEACRQLEAILRDQPENQVARDALSNILGAAEK